MREEAGLDDVGNSLPLWVKDDAEIKERCTGKDLSGTFLRKHALQRL